MRGDRLKKILWVCVYFVLIPLLVVVGLLLFQNQRYNAVSLGVAFLGCVPFYIRFERGRMGAREMVTLSVMSALAVLGRLIFTPVPAFKPVSAMVMIAGMAFGPEAGFMTGSMTALVSNIFFGQGPWTPFQMLTWGLIGFFSGLIFQRGKEPSRRMLTVSGILSGVLFSLGMDVWTTLSVEGAFSWQRYGFYALSALPTTACYAVSNVIFLLLLSRPMLKKTERLRVKYGVFQQKP